MDDRLPKHLRDYLNFSSNLNKSASTIREYRYDLVNFLRFIKWTDLKSHNKKLKIEDIEPSKDSVKEKALADALKSIEKTYGKGSIMKLGDANLEKVEVIPTGSITLDIALGVGGYPKGRIIEIYGLS